MRTVLSLSLDQKTFTQTRRLARRRGFATTSEYVRHLIEMDDAPRISEQEVLRRAKRAATPSGKKRLLRAPSMRDLLKM